jgi:hypothetical protein
MLHESKALNMGIAGLEPRHRAWQGRARAQTCGRGHRSGIVDEVGGIDVGVEQPEAPQASKPYRRSGSVPS